MGVALHPELEAFARDCARTALGRLGRTARIELLGAGAATVTLRVTPADGPRLVLKAATAAGGPFDPERTAAVMAMARGAGVPVPEVLSVHAGAGGTRAHLVHLHVDGVPWAQVHPTLGEDDVRPVHRRLAEAVLALQGVAVPGFGELDAAGRPAGVDVGTALHRRARLRIGDPDLRALAEDLIDREEALLRGSRPALTHDDLHSGNVVLAPGGGRWRLAAVIDWDKAWAGPAESDVARTAFWDGMTGPGFWEVYRAAVPAGDTWPRRALVHQLLWCLEYDVPTERHRAGTAAVARALGIDLPTPGRA